MRNVKKTRQCETIIPTVRTNPDYILYKTILETSMDGFWITDINGNILDVNKAYCKMIGYSRQKLLSMNIADLEVLESPAEIKKHIKLLNKIGSHSFTTKHRCKNGKIIELEVSANNIKHDSIKLFSFFRDITEKKQVEEALRASEKRFRNTIDNMLEGCQIISRNWKYLYLNNAVIKQSRKSKDELLEHTMMEAYPGIENTPLFKILQECMEHQKSCQVKNEFLFPDGNKGWFNLSIQPVPEGIFILSLDITDRIKAEDEVIKAKKDWENIFQAIGQPSFILDPERKIIAVNRATVTMTGKPEEQLIGKKCYKVLHKKDGYPKGCPFEKILSSGHMETKEMEIEILGGIYLVSCTPVFNDQGVLEKVIHIATDITERKQAEKKIYDYQKQLKQMTSEILFAEEHERHRIAAGIHDDIGQRLAIIKFGLDSLQASESRPDALLLLKRECELISDAIEEIRSFAFELSNPILYEIGVEAAVETWLIDYIQNKCGIKYKFISRGPKIDLTEETRIILFQGVRELLTNIVKHAKADHVKIHIIRSRNDIHIKIEDNGTGFNYNQDNMYQKGKKGFGLFNLRERLEYLGGRLEIQNASPRGTLALIYVPIEYKEKTTRETLS